MGWEGCGRGNKWQPDGWGALSGWVGGWVAGEQATSGGFVLLFVNLVLRSGVLPHSCSGDVYLCCSRGEHVGRCQAGALTLLLEYGAVLGAKAFSISFLELSQPYLNCLPELPLHCRCS